MLFRSSDFKDAVDLMQKMALQKQDLQEVLEAVKARRAEEAPFPTPCEPTASVLYRWCMGEGGKESAETENPLRKKLMRDQIRNDQMWISGIVGVSAVAALLIQG